MRLQQLLLLVSGTILVSSYNIPETISLKTANGSSYIVYNDKDLLKTKEGYLLSGRLGASYTIEEFIDLRALDREKCKTRAWEVSKPFLHANAGTIIRFFDGSPAPEGWVFNGSVQSLVIGNDRTVTVRAWGFPEGISLPNNSEIFFSSKQWCEPTCKDASFPEYAGSYFQVKCDHAILGADATFPNLGLVKKGTRINFTTPRANMDGCAGDNQTGGKIVIY